MMRRATYDYGWLCAGSGQFQGVNLGFDMVAEQEGSVQELFSRFGLNAPDTPVKVGPVPGQRIELTPTDLWFHRYVWEVKDEPAKSQPAAILLLGDQENYDARHLPVYTRAYDLQLWDNSDGTPATDVACSWSETQLGLNVRRIANVEKLAKLYNAILVRQVEITLPVTDGRVVRTGPVMTLTDA
jgi:hypothetical protein